MIDPDNSSETHRPERRTDSRKEFAVKVELHVAEYEAPLRTKTVDLSANGCYLEMIFTLQVGTKVEITLSINDLKLKTEGVVITRNRQVGNGIQFTSMSAEDRAKLKQLLAAAQGA
jgi:c-di-GMP-binding flagellar brake protein YcgR